MKTKYLSLLNTEEQEFIIQKIPKGETPLWAHWPKYVDAYLNLGRSEVTIKRVYETLRFFIKNTELKTIESWLNKGSNIQEKLFQIQKERNWSYVTYNTYAKNIKSYFNFLNNTEITDDNLGKKIYRATEKPKAQNITNLEEIKKVLYYINNKKYVSSLERYRNKLFILLCSISGARPVQLLRLDISAFSDDRTTVYIGGAKQKGKPLVYELPIEIVDLLKSYIRTVVELGRSRELEDSLFLSVSQKGKPWTNEGVNKFYRRIKKDTRIHFNAYMIRRYVVTKLLDEWKDEPIKAQMFMGHNRLSTTLRYYQPSEVTTNAGVNTMSKGLF